MAKPVSQRTEELYQVLHPGCGIINYFRFIKENMHHTKSPIVKCRCGDVFSLLEAELYVAGVYEKIESRPLVERQAVNVWFINPHAVGGIVTP